MTWSINQEFGHCVHSNGLEAFYVSEATPSGAVRCVGPYGVNAKLAANHVIAAVFDLTKGLEILPQFSSNYVVWGVIENSVGKDSQTIDLLGEACRWVPNALLRTQSAIRRGRGWPHGFLSREWRLNEVGLSHRAGFSIMSIGGWRSLAQGFRVLGAEDSDETVLCSELRERLMESEDSFVRSLFEAVAAEHCSGYRNVP